MEASTSQQQASDAADGHASPFRIPRRKEEHQPEQPVGHGHYASDGQRNSIPQSQSSPEKLRLKMPPKRDFGKQLTPSPAANLTPRKRPLPMEEEANKYAKLEQKKLAKQKQELAETPFDRVLLSFEKEERQAKQKASNNNDLTESSPRERKREKKPSAAATSITPKAEPGLSVSEPQKVQLTEANLQKYAKNDSMAYSFLQRDTLMERLLGHKMLIGRIESYNNMGYVKVDPKTERIRAYPDDDELDAAGPSNRQMSVISQVGSGRPKTPPLTAQLKSEPEQTPHEQRRPKGPKTPPGSPGPRTPPPEPSMLSEMDRTAIISQMAQYTGLNTTQLEASLGEELKKAVNSMDKNALLETLRNALRNAGATGHAYALATPIAMPTYPPFEIKKQSPSHLSDSISVKMELVSDCSLSPGSPSRDIKPSAASTQQAMSVVPPAGIPQQGVLPPPPIAPPAACMPPPMTAAVYMPYMQMPMPAYVVPPPSLPPQQQQMPPSSALPPQMPMPQQIYPPPQTAIPPPPPPVQPPAPPSQQAQNVEGPKYTFPPPALALPVSSNPNTSVSMQSIQPPPVASTAPANSSAYAPYSMPPTVVQQMQQTSCAQPSNVHISQSTAPVFSASVPPPPPPVSATSAPISQPLPSQPQQQPMHQPNMAYPPPPSMMSVPPPNIGAMPPPPQNFAFPPPMSMSQAPPPSFMPIAQTPPPPPPPVSAPTSNNSTPQKIDEKPKLRLEVKLIELEPEKPSRSPAAKRDINNPPADSSYKRHSEDARANQFKNSPKFSAPRTQTTPTPSGQNSGRNSVQSIEPNSEFRPSPNQGMASSTPTTSQNRLNKTSISIRQELSRNNGKSNGPPKPLLGLNTATLQTPPKQQMPAKPSATPQFSIQNTLLSALGLSSKQSGSCTPSQQPPGAFQTPPLNSSSGPRPQIIQSGSEPVLLDRYGQPLPVPGESRERIRPSQPPTQPHPTAPNMRFGPPTQPPPHFR